MQPVPPTELGAVCGGLAVALQSPITISASNTAVVNAPQVNVNIRGIAIQGVRLFP